MASILLIDDDAVARALMELELLQAGYQVVLAEDGDGGLSLARTSPPDVIVSDVMMPQMDGFELCRRCKADPLLKQIPIILCSADYIADNEQQLGQDVGACRYLLKPVVHGAVTAAVQQVLSIQQGAQVTDDESPELDKEMEFLRGYNEVLFNKLQSKMQELQQTINEHRKSEESLKVVQSQIIQQEKMASIGQLAAGVAHEINNPMGFITSNLTSLGKYAERLDTYIAALQGSLAACPHHPGLEELDGLRQKLKIDYIISDVTQLITESLDGANRVRRIVQDLKSFSRLDQAETSRVNLNDCLDTTINIAWNELKYVATLERQFGELPDIVCNLQQLNQVFLNLLVNAAQAMEQQGTITVRTWVEPGWACVSIADTGRGMPQEVCSRIFEPFFTTKPAGKGTGLGLSISADIVHKHNGEISVMSSPGEGTTFTVRFPLEA
jgi:signal transduction histidine kinase